MYGLTYLFSNWGANTSTFIVPSEAFPTRIRATAHGLSAAAGKIGATVGNSLLIYVYNAPCAAGNCASGSAPGADVGVVNVMWVCAGVCAGGALMTAWLTKETMGVALEDVDAGSRVEAAHTAATAELVRTVEEAGGGGDAGDRAPVLNST